MLKINIAKDFSITPGTRYKTQGDFSGEEFREKILKPKFEKALGTNEKIEVTLDGTFGYFNSFLEESFGGLARIYNDNTIFNKFVFVSDEDPSLIQLIKTYILDSLKTKK